jgi:hypothetical protein
VLLPLGIYFVVVLVLVVMMLGLINPEEIE